MPGVNSSSEWLAEYNPYSNTTMLAETELLCSTVSDDASTHAVNVRSVLCPLLQLHCCIFRVFLSCMMGTFGSSLFHSVQCVQIQQYTTRLQLLLLETTSSLCIGATQLLLYHVESVLCQGNT